MDPHNPEIAAMLTFRDHSPKPDDQGCLRLSQQLQPLFPIFSDNSPLIVNRGLLMPLMGVAQLHGLEPDVRYFPSGYGVQRVDSADSNSSQVCPQVLDLLEHTTHGLIRHALSETELVRFIIVIAAAFPHAKLAFVSTRRAVLKRIYAALPDELQRETTLADADDQAQPPRRVLLCTPYGLAPCANWDDRRQITVLLNADEIAHDRMQTALLWQRTRLFGLVPMDLRLPPRTRDLMFAAFGPEEVSLPALGSRSRRVETVFCRPAGKFTETSYAPWELTKHLIEHHGGRNEALAIVAHALARGKPIDDRLERPLPTMWQRPLRTVVLVQTVEHAQLIGRGMTAWPIVVDADVYLDGLDDRHRFQTVTEFLAGDKPNLIATVAAAENLPWQSFDAIVWAGGGSDGPPISMRNLTCPAAVDQRLLLVDVHDRHQVDLQRQTAKRRRHYDARDWFPVGSDDAARRSMRYLRERSESL